MDPRMQAQLDLAARKQGFKNYAQWQAWNAQRQQQGQGYTVQQGGAAPVQPQPAPQNWLQQLLGAVNPLNYVNQRTDRAFNGRR